MIFKKKNDRKNPHECQCPNWKVDDNGRGFCAIMCRPFDKEEKE